MAPFLSPRGAALLSLLLLGGCQPLYEGTAQPPQAPQSVQATGAAWHALRVTWSVPSERGAPVTGYVVTASTGGVQNVILPSASFSDLPVNTPLTFTVVAQTALGSSAVSTPSAPALAPELPTAPREVSVVPSIRGLSLHWLPPDSDGHSPLTAYRVVDFSSQTTQDVAPSETGLVLHDVPSTAPHAFRLLAINVAGASPPSPDTASVTSLPAAPTLEGLSVGDGACRPLTFQLAQADGVPVQLSLEVANDSASPWRPGTLLDAGTALPTAAAGLPTPLTLTWNATTDFPEQTLPQARLRLTASIPGADPAQWLVSPLPVANAFSLGGYQLYPAGSEPSAVAVGDVNRDGKLDLVVANGGEPSLSLLLGDGHGGFGAQRKIPTAGIPGYLTLADVNGDGVLDLVACTQLDAAHGYKVQVEVFLGSASGAYTSLPANPLGEGRLHLLAADLNHDGKLDLALAGNGETGVLIGKGDGTFAPEVEYTEVSWNQSALALGDLNGDGTLDLVTANVISSQLYVRLGHGDGTFASPVSYQAASFPNALALADVDGDGKLDVVSAGDGAALLLRGNGDGTLAAGQLLSGAYAQGDMALEDVDGDGKPDLVLPQGSGLSFVPGNGVSFGPPRSVGRSLPTQTVALGDFNADGALDTVAVVIGLDGVFVQLGVEPARCAVRYTASATQAAQGYVEQVAAADLDGDGKLDGVVLSSSPPAVQVFPGRGDGTLSSAHAYPLSSSVVTAYALVVGDFNSDGISDVVAGAGGLHFFPGRRGAGLGTEVSVGTACELQQLEAADLDRDGKLDLLVGCRGARAVQVVFGNGNGTFRQGPLIPLTYTTAAIHLADLDGDGKLDLVYSALEIGNVPELVIRAGNGDGTFGVEQGVAGTLSAAALATLDLDGDGRLDVVASGDVFRNLGAFHFGQLRSSTSFLANGEIHPLDLNRDGHLDVITAEEGIRVDFGAGDGGFGASSSLFHATGGTVAVGDFNRDGIPDLFVPQRDSSEVNLATGR